MFCVCMHILLWGNCVAINQHTRKNTINIVNLLTKKKTKNTQRYDLDTQV